MKNCRAANSGVAVTEQAVRSQVTTTDTDFSCILRHNIYPAEGDSRRRGWFIVVDYVGLFKQGDMCLDDANPVFRQSSRKYLTEGILLSCEVTAPK